MTKLGFDHIADQKRELRQRLRFRRNHFAANLDMMAKLAAFRALPADLAELSSQFCCIGGYASVGGEADILPILCQLASGRQIALPFHAARRSKMEFRQWQPGDTLTTGPWHTPQPADSSPPLFPDLLLVPLLGFDRDGGRLGQGGGHYDRYFAAHPDAFRIGIAWSVQEIDRVPLCGHDALMDAILTEQEWIMTGNRW